MIRRTFLKAAIGLFSMAALPKRNEIELYETYTPPETFINWDPDYSPEHDHAYLVVEPDEPRDLSADWKVYQQVIANRKAGRGGRPINYADDVWESTADVGFHTYHPADEAPIVKVR